MEFVSRFIHTLLPSPIDMHPEPDAPFIRTGKLLRIIDGDTYEVEIDLGWDIRITTDVRLFLVNTPEKRGVERVAGQYVAKCVRQWIEDISGVIEGAPVTISSRKYKAGKYGRCIARLWFGGECLNDWLLSSRLGWKCGGDGALMEDRNISNLTLPSDVIAEVRSHFNT